MKKVANILRKTPLIKFLGLPKKLEKIKYNSKTRIIYQRKGDLNKRKKTSFTYPNLHPNLSKKEVYKNPEIKIYDLKNAKCFGENIAVINSSNQVIPDLSGEWGRKLDDHKIFKLIQIPTVKKYSGKALLLESPGGATYFHWITDCLGKIKILNEAKIPINKFRWIVVGAKKKDL